MITKKSDWSQMTEGQQNGVLQAIYERGTKHMRLRDYMNSTLVSWDWRETLSSASRVIRLQHVYRISMSLLSTCLFNRFINEASRIDQSDSPKSYKIQEQGANPFIPMLVVYHESLSQKDYEIRELNRARELAMGTAYSIDEYNQLLRFDKMSNEDRNNPLNSIKSINEFDLIHKTDTNTYEIDYLINKYKKFSTKLNITDEIFGQNILPKIIKGETNMTLDFFLSMIILITLLLVVISYVSELVLFY